MSETRPRILVVDDEVEMMRALRDALTAHGFDVVGLTDPREALAAVRDGGFDLLLTDLMMPGMNGLELLRGVLGIVPELAVVVMTGHAAVPTAVEAMKSGAFDFVLKPFKIRDILPTLRRGLGLRRGGSAGPTHDGSR